jgi:non-lysosomal glucosylceramidase
MRKCKCSGHCAPAPNDLTRREFLGIMGTGTAAALLSGADWAKGELTAGDLQRLRQDLLVSDKPRRYFSDQHTDARMHLGGIGTGNFEIGVDGQFTTWQLFNTLRDGHVPFYFAVKAGNVARLLQIVGGPDWPRVKRIEMTGEYPIAGLRFSDSELPVQVDLTAFSPFAPLDTRFSSMPAAVFILRIKNPTAQVQKVSIAGFMQNPVGYDAAGDNQGVENPAFGFNLNKVFHENQAGGLLMHAETGGEPSLDKPVILYAYENLRALSEPPADRPSNLTVNLFDGNSLLPEGMTDPAQTVIWFEEPRADLAEPILRAARDAVQAGATLIFSGKSMPLLDVYASCTGGGEAPTSNLRPDILFDDFESGYGKWKVEGTAFGDSPAGGTLPNQQPVSGFVGKRLVNSFLQGDASTGRLISKPFIIERHFIRFKIGGGHYANTQIRLLTEDKVVRATSGNDKELLEFAFWDVKEFEGRQAHIEIVDQEKGPWGHINIDQIEFSDIPGNRAILSLLAELLPARFSRIIPANNGQGVRFENWVLVPGATQETNNLVGETATRKLRRGKVVVVRGSVLDPINAGLSNQRRNGYAFLCSLVGANYSGADGRHNSLAPGIGTLALATLGSAVTVRAAFEDWGEAWAEFSSQGRFAALDQAANSSPTELGRTINGAVANSVDVPAGQTVEVPFILTWHYPNKYGANQNRMGCHYATVWPTAEAVLREAAENLATLRERTETFRKTFYDSTLPYWLLDCLTANAAILRHIGVLFRIADGDVYGWEGSNGCCDPTCTHVWGYEQSLAHLFPDLEKAMRRIDFKHQQSPDGGINNRTDVPSPPHPTGEHPFSDGHASCILKAYREALNHPDEALFKEYWPHIQRAVEYLIDRDAKASGGDACGVLQNDQWNTYDEALHGVTTFISGYYLAALRAGEEWARRMSESETADHFHSIFERGRKRLIELCWNGEYFEQHLPDYGQRQGEIGPGCMSDQLIGQWWAHQLGLGYILPEDKVKSALRSIFKYNFKPDLTGWKHSPRAFAGDKDKGLIICTWPKGGRPSSVMLYSDEVWTGIEYQVAAHMIYEGFVDEAFAITKGARDRYNGVPRPPIKRNPWCEIECGGHYARAMSSWSILLALSGCQYDGPQGLLHFAPRFHPEEFRSFFSGPEGWGYIAQEANAGMQKVSLGVDGGQVSLQTLRLDLIGSGKASKAATAISGRSIPASLQIKDGRAQISFGREKIIIHRSEKLEVTLS